MSFKEEKYRCMADCKHTELSYVDSPCNKCQRNNEIQKQLGKGKKLKDITDCYIKVEGQNG